MSYHPRPPATGLTTAAWISRVPAIRVPVGSVIPTQGVDPDVVLAKVDQPHTSHTADPYGHVVVVDGKWLIEDGHHRYAAAVLRGDSHWHARVYVLESA